jgi:hypothetical protein
MQLKAMESPVDRILSREPVGVVAKTWDGLERGFDSVGLMSGEGAQAKRFLFGNILGGGAMYALKPGFAFDASGARPWALLEPNAKNKTAMPWWMPGVALGFFCGFMV